MKKLLSICLAMTMLFATSVSAFATDYNKNNRYNANNRVITNEEVIYVEDDEGNVFPVTIIEHINVSNNSTITPKSFSPEHEIGTTKTYEIKISNQALGAPSSVEGVVKLTNAMKSKAAKAVASALTKKLGSKFIPGLNIASTVLSLVSWGNGQLGNNGFVFSVDLEYSEHYYNKDGYYVYGWDIKSVDLSTY